MTLEKSPVRTPTTVERKQTLIHRGVKSVHTPLTVYSETVKCTVVSG